MWIWGWVQTEVWLQWPWCFLSQEWRLDPLDLVVSVQHHLRDRLPGAPEVLQQPHAPARGPGVCGTEPRGKVGTLSAPASLSSCLLSFQRGRSPGGFRFGSYSAYSGIQFCWAQWPSSLPDILSFWPKLEGDSITGGHRGACRVHSAGPFPGDWRPRSRGSAGLGSLETRQAGLLGSACSC